MDTSIVKFNVADSAIAEMGAKYLPLVINGIDDKVGFQMVHAARMEVKRTRLEVEKTRKDLKADALRYSQAVDGEARRITALLEPIESHLEGQELAVIKAKEKIKLEEEATKDRLAQERVDAMQLFGVSLSFMMARSMTPEAFAQAFKIAEEQHAVAEAQRKKEQEEAAREAERREIERKAEEERLAEERRKLAEERKIEEARLAEERKRQEIEQAELKASRQKLIEERIALEKEIQKIEAQKAEKARQEEIEQAKKEAAEKAVEEAARKAEADAWAAAELERIAAEEAARLEALRPDRIKLKAWASEMHEIVGPVCETEAGIKIVKETYKRLMALERWMRKEILALEGGVE